MQFYNVKQVADLLHVTETTVRTWCTEGITRGGQKRLEAQRIGSRYRISQDALDAFLDS